MSMSMSMSRVVQDVINTFVWLVCANSHFNYCLLLLLFIMYELIRLIHDLLLPFHHSLAVCARSIVPTSVQPTIHSFASTSNKMMTIIFWAKHKLLFVIFGFFFLLLQLHLLLPLWLRLNARRLYLWMFTHLDCMLCMWAFFVPIHRRSFSFVARDDARKME